MSPRVVIAGGGVGALEAALALRALTPGDLEVDVVAPESRFVYRPFVVAEPFGGGAPWSHDLGILLGSRGIRHRRDAVESVDPHARVVKTRGGDSIPYDALLVAMGARAFSAVPGALTFMGAAGVAQLRTLLAELETGEVRSVAFTMPPGVTWGLPLYELALQTRSHLARRGVHPRLEVVPPEAEPLAVFGSRPSRDLRAQLEERDIGFRTAYPYRFEGGVLLLVPEDSISVDAVVALPAHRGPGVEGLPSDAMGFIPTDEFCAVRGVESVWAAGDAIDFPIKQGGLATQQADVAAAAIAARLGASVRPRPFRPVLRGVVTGGERPRFMRADVIGGSGQSPPSRSSPFWFPPAKIAGRYLAPFLAAYGAPRLPAEPAEAVP